MEKTRLFCRINGVDYYDWVIYWNKTRYDYGKADIVIGHEILNSMQEPDSLLDDTFIPALGSKIHVVPVCPVGMADIRKNYVTKRNLDDGCCNVFSPFKGNYHYIGCELFAIVPTRKAFVVQESCYPRNQQDQMLNLNRRITTLFQDLTDEEAQQLIFVKGEDQNYSYASWFYRGDFPQAYVDLFFGKLTKPCVSYKKLEFKCENELTMDTLYLVYRAGMAKWSSDAEEKFKLQLCALNEHNWRDYPGTINMLFRDVLGFYRNSSTYCASTLNSISKIPKAAKELVLSGNNNDKYASQKDFELAQSLMMYAVGMPKDLKFTDMQTLREKFKEARISINSFYNCFNNIVKITPKQFEDES